jgi:hypothetical protein
MVITVLWTRVRDVFAANASFSIAHFVQPSFRPKDIFTPL